MTKTNHEYLNDLLRELRDIIEFTVDGEAAFMADVKTQKAVIRSYEVVGEICKRLPIALREANPSVDWRKLIGFRDFLAHNYEHIGLRFVWQAVEDVQNLYDALRSVLENLAPEE